MSATHLQSVEEGENPYRLPRTVVPRRYDLLLVPDLDAATFDGEVTIALDVLDPTARVVLNAVDLEIGSARLVSGDSSQDAVDITSDADTERATLTFAESVEPGPTTLHLTFSGVLNDLLRGFYRSTYTADDGSSRTLATTQFESTSARRAFPCFDEPDLKAVFGVTLDVAAELTAVSCGPLIATEPSPDAARLRHRFDDTMVMSTYLLAFIVGELEATDAVDVDGVPVRILHVPGKAHLTAFALETAVGSLRFLVDYYGIPYPGAKLDLIAVPDFAAGAMENLGCVTFRETMLLADAATTTTAELGLIANVVAHELAHMWFGDLVTMTWWNGIWLKEAFATFMAILTVDHLHPEWRVWDQFGRDRTAAFDVDALQNTRAIEFPVVSPADAEGMYDILTYEKGAAVVRMLEQYMVPERFQAGVHEYLVSNSYGNTETTDLWDALERSSGEPVRRTMDSWIFQGGFPLVSIQATDHGVTLHQARFSYAPAPSDASWSTPVIVRSRIDGGESEHRVLLETDSAEIDLGGRPEWVVANSGAHGFYRVRYAPELLASLVAQAQELLSPAERYALVDDLWAAVIAGHVPARTFVDLVSGFTYEPDVGVWRIILDGLRNLDRVVSGEARAALQRQVAAITTHALDIVGHEPADDEEALTKELRAVLLGGAAKLGNDPSAIARSRELVDRLGTDPSGIEPNLAAAAISVVATHGSASDHDEYLARFRSAATPQDELRYLMALTEMPGDVEFANALQMTLGEVRSQTAPLMLARALGHRDLGREAWAFIRDNWDELIDRFPMNLRVRMVSGIVALNDEQVADDVERFLADHELPNGKLLVQQHIEKMRLKVALRAREADRLAAALLD